MVLRMAVRSAFSARIGTSDFAEYDAASAITAATATPINRILFLVIQLRVWYSGARVLGKGEELKTIFPFPSKSPSFFPCHVSYPGLDAATRHPRFSHSHPTLAS